MLELALSQNAHMLVLRNTAARIELGLPVDADLRRRVAESILRVSDTPERRIVLDVLGI